MEQTFLKKINKTSSAEVSNHRKIRLILLILTIAGTVFALTEYGVTTAIRRDGTTEYSYTEFNGAFGLVLIFAAAYFGMFAVIGIFKDMVNKQTADVQMSLPMSAKERYLSKLTALFKIHILPLLCSEVVLIVIGGLMTTYSGTLYLVRMYTVIMAQALFVDSVTIFCMCCCGALAEGVYTSLISMFCLSITPFCTFQMLMVKFSGLNNSDAATEEMFSLVGVLSMQWIPGFEIKDGGWGYLFGNILISCLLIFAAFFIYRKRDARRVGRPFAFDVFMELFMFIGLFTLYMLFFSSNITVIGIVTTFIVYFVIRIIASRAKINTKVFMVWLAKFAASMAAFYLVVMVAYFTGGFGFYKYFPNTSDMESVTVYIRTQDKDYVYRTFKNDTHSKQDTKFYTGKCHDLVRKYNKIDDRTVSSFFEDINGKHSYSLYSYSRYEQNWVEISIYRNNLKPNSDYSEQIYDMEMFLSSQELDSAVAEIQRIFTEEEKYLR